MADTGHCPSQPILVALPWVPLEQRRVPAPQCAPAGFHLAATRGRTITLQPQARKSMLDMPKVLENSFEPSLWVQQPI